MKKIVLCGNFGGINTGDEAILQGFLSVLKDNCDLTVLSHNPAHTSEHFGVKSCYVFPMGIRSMIKNTFNGEKRKTLDAIKQADIFILGGGSLFTDEESAKAPLMWSWQVKAAKSCDTKVVMFGQTVGPLKGDYAKAVTKDSFDMASDIFVRDQASVSLLKKMGVNKSATVTADCALLLYKKDEFGISNSHGPVLLVPRDWPEATSVVEIKKMITANTGKEVEVISLYRNTEDFELSIKNKTSQRKMCISPNSLISKMQKSSLVVSMRLHGNILAAVAGVPFLPLSYSPKVNNFVKSIDYPLTLACQNLESEKMKNAIVEITANWPTLKNELNAKMENLSAETESYLKALLK